MSDQDTPPLAVLRAVRSLVASDAEVSMRTEWHVGRRGRRGRRATVTVFWPGFTGYAKGTTIEDVADTVEIEIDAVPAEEIASGASTTYFATQRALDWTPSDGDWAFYAGQLLAAGSVLGLRAQELTAGPVDRESAERALGLLHVAAADWVAALGRFREWRNGR